MISNYQIISDLLSDLQERIESLEKYPKMYGSSEAQEFTMLLLVEMCAKLLRPEATKKNPFEVRDAWMNFIQAVNGEETNTFLHVILKEENKLDLLPQLLGDAARWIIQKYPSEQIY